MQIENKIVFNQINLIVNKLNIFYFIFIVFSIVANLLILLFILHNLTFPSSYSLLLSILHVMGKCFMYFATS